MNRDCTQDKPIRSLNKLHQNLTRSLIALRRRYRSFKRYVCKYTGRYAYTYLLFALILTGILSFTYLVSAREIANPGHETYYTSIRVEPGDTLWDIAAKTMPSEYTSVNDYVKVLRKMNSLQSDDIQAGYYLIVSYEKR